MNMVTAKTVKAVLDMDKNGVDKAEIAGKCGISVESVESILESSNQNKIHIDSDQMSLWKISNELDCESDNINGIANLLECVSNSIDELNVDALHTLSDNLSNIHKRLNGLSKSIMELHKNKA